MRSLSSQHVLLIEKTLVFTMGQPVRWPCSTSLQVRLLLLALVVWPVVFFLPITAIKLSSCILHFYWQSTTDYTIVTSSEHIFITNVQHGLSFRRLTRIQVQFPLHFSVKWGSNLLGPFGPTLPHIPHQLPLPDLFKYSLRPSTSRGTLPFCGPALQPMNGFGGL